MTEHEPTPTPPADDSSVSFERMLLTVTIASLSAIVVALLFGYRFGWPPLLVGVLAGSIYAASAALEPNVRGSIRDGWGTPLVGFLLLGVVAIAASVLFFFPPA